MPALARPFADECLNKCVTAVLRKFNMVEDKHAQMVHSVSSLLHINLNSNLIIKKPFSSSIGENIDTIFNSSVLVGIYRYSSDFPWAHGTGIFFILVIISLQCCFILFQYLFCRLGKCLKCTLLCRKMLHYPVNSPSDFHLLSPSPITWYGNYILIFLFYSITWIKS